VQSTPPKIDLLPEHLIDQIKAGEVIERPANLIKEILENAMDAGATELDLQIKNGGLDLIALKDNGHGMTYNDLPLAFSRHATSKLQKFEDLFGLHTYGFRGEALASIASIARVHCTSFISSEKEGSEIKIEGAQTLYHGQLQKSGKDHGTELYIKDLFFNTPARLKFTQSQNTEKLFLKKVFYSFVVSHPEVKFSLEFDEDERIFYPAKANLNERLMDLLPIKSRKEIEIQTVSHAYDGIEVQGSFIPQFVKTPVKWAYLFINNRLILDKQLHRIITESLQTLFYGQEMFQYCISIKVPTDEIDVNVHPSKTVVKCLSHSKLVSLLTASIKQLKPTTPITPSIDNRHPTSEQPKFDLDNKSSWNLTQQEQNYNFDGVFSPHQNQMNPNSSENWTWVTSEHVILHENDVFFCLQIEKCLSLFIQEKLKLPTLSIPLLVSESFSYNSKNNLWKKLNDYGFELEPLGDILVLRGIPDWLNGYPLKLIVEKILAQKDYDRIDIKDLELRSRDLSLQTLEEMINFCGHSKLLEMGLMVALDKPHLSKLFKS